MNEILFVNELNFIFSIKSKHHDIVPGYILKKEYFDLTLNTHCFFFVALYILDAAMLKDVEIVAAASNAASLLTEV